MVCLLVVYCSVVFRLVVPRLHLVTVFLLFAYVVVLLGVVLVFKHSMYHRIRTTTEAQYAPPYSHDNRGTVCTTYSQKLRDDQYAPPYSRHRIRSATRRLKHSMHHGFRTATRRLRHSMHHHIRTTTGAQYAPPYSHDDRSTVCTTVFARHATIEAQFTPS